MSKIIYHYNPSTSEFIGAGEADASPLDKDTFIIPAHATDLEPPVLSANEAAVFDGGWQVVADFRGQTFFDAAGNSVKIESLGDVPANLSSTVPQAIVLERAKIAKMAEINTACGTSITNGFTSSALGTPHAYSSTLEDQANLLSLITGVVGGAFTCANAVGVKARRPHTDAQLKTLLADGRAHIEPKLDRARQLKDQVQAAADSAAVEAVKW